MLNAIYKNLIWMTLPVSLAIGCAADRPQAEAVYSPLPAGRLEATSALPEQQIYDASVPSDVTPGSATAANWKLGEEIRERLLADRTIGSYPESLRVEVGNGGIVTLRGSVRSRSEERRTCESIATLPGVNRIDNELVVGGAENTGTLDFGPAK